MLGPRWAGAPSRARLVVGAFVVVFAYGTAVHVLQLMGSGLAPRPTAPAPLNAYFVALTVLDPLTAGLLARGRRSGVVLAVLVLVTDAAANAYADYVTAGSGVAARVGQAGIAALAVVMLISAPMLWRHSSPDRAPR